MTYSRKIVALICVAALLCAALSLASYGLLWAVLVPFFILFGILLALSAEVQEQAASLQKITFSAAIASRAPPLTDPLI